VKGGRCEACQGDGVVKVEMHFLPDVYVPCDVCRGRRYSRETLEVRYKGLDIHEVLNLTVDEAREIFSAVPVLARKLETLAEVGLGYVTLGQSATTLSGGEAQRVKLALELSKRDTGRTLYILDEPTTGLHFQDVELLLAVLHRLRDHGNTVVVIEHNLDVIKTADWLIDLGPEGGDGGGRIVVTGTPEQRRRRRLHQRRQRRRRPRQRRRRRLRRRRRPPGRQRQRLQQRLPAWLRRRPLPSWRSQRGRGRQGRQPERSSSSCMNTPNMADGRMSNDSASSARDTAEPATTRCAGGILGRGPWVGTVQTVSEWRQSAAPGASGSSRPTAP
jgi:ABC-type multidrug transport system ATPase subunit